MIRTQVSCALLAAGALAATVLAQQPIAPIPLNLNAVRAMHIANRLTFGQTEALVNQLTGPTGNYYAWLNTQLAPNPANDNPDVANLLAQVNGNAGMPDVNNFTMGLGYRYRDIQNGVFVYSAVSDFQLQARMGHFWERHFNTYANRVRGVLNGAYTPNLSEAESLTCSLEWADYDYYRENAFGKFRDLVDRTFYSPAMIIYLDTYFNRCNNPGDEPNENMARELMELHCIGTNYAPTGGLNYGPVEIETIARVMSGWGIRGTGYNGIFLRKQFNPALHCTGSGGMSLFGQHAGLPPYTSVSGQNGVDHLLDYLVGTDACADFICRKLMTDFMGDGSDVLYPAVLTDMKASWGPTGDIQAVLYAMLTSGEFLGQTKRWRRAKTPMESAIAHVRVWNGSFRATPSSPNPEIARVEYVRLLARDIGQSLFLFPSPDGFALESNEQPGSGIMLETLKMFSESYYTNVANPPSAAVRFDFPGFVQGSLPQSQWNDVPAITTLLLERAYAAGWKMEHYLAVGRALAVDVNGVGAPLDYTSSDYGPRVGQAVTTAMGLTRGFLR